MRARRRRPARRRAPAASSALSASRTIVHARARPSSMPARSQMISSRRRSDHLTCEPVPSSSARFHRAGATSKAGVARHRLRVDGEPGGAVGGEHVRVVQVGVQQPVLGRRPRRRARPRGRPPGRGSAGAGPLAPPAAPPPAAGRMPRGWGRGDGPVGEPGQQVTDDAARLVDVDAAEVAGVQPLEQHGETRGVGPHEPDGAVAVPRLQGQVLRGAPPGAAR